MTWLVHLGAGVGNIVLATPLLVALHELGFTVDVLLAADYPETVDLLRPWSVVREVFAESASPPARLYDRVLSALPPFYARQYGRRWIGQAHLMARPPDALFYENEQAYYLWFARALGWAGVHAPFPTLPIGPTDAEGVTTATLVLAPGCKTGEMAAKRWPFFGELSEAFEEVAVVGTADDLRRADGPAMAFPPHVRSLVGKLSLRQTAELMAGAGVVVGNDSGLAHVAAAVGTPTVMIFGPTPHTTLGSFAPNVRVLRAGLPCEPCWFRDRFRRCDRRIDCLAAVEVSVVIREIETLGCSAGRSKSGSDGKFPLIANDLGARATYEEHRAGER